MLGTRVPIGHNLRFEQKQHEHRNFPSENCRFATVKIAEYRIYRRFNVLNLFVYVCAPIRRKLSSHVCMKNVCRTDVLRCYSYHKNSDHLMTGKRLTLTHFFSSLKCCYHFRKCIKRHILALIIIHQHAFLRLKERTTAQTFENL